MSSILFKEPIQEPVTKDEIKDQIGITDEISDPVLLRRITEAREWAENFCQRSFITQTWDLFLDCWPADGVLPLPRGPVQSVTYVKYIDAAGVPQTISSANYKLGAGHTLPRLVPAYGLVWPSARDEIDAINVRYVAGYGVAGEDVPGPIREAIMLIVGHWVEHQPAIESGVRITRIPYAVEHLLQAYRVMSF